MPDDRTTAARRRQAAGSLVAAGTGVHASPNALVSSAEVMKAKRANLKAPEGWQEEAWGYYDNTPELRFACAWYSAALSRVRLTLATRSAPGDDPQPLEAGHPALALLADLGSQEGQSQLMADMAPHLVVPGIGIVVGTDIDTNPLTGEVLSRSWTVVSSDDMRVVSGTDGGGDVWEAKDDEGKFGPLAAGTLPVKIWRRHARHRRQADSPVRALLPILRELHLLTEHVEATATSRLAGAGVFAIPAEATLPISKSNQAAEDPFLAEFVDAMITPIGDRNAASAVVPLLLRVPGEFLQLVKFISFATPFDELALKLREEARVRFAAGMDMPAEILLGLGDVNHWSAWQIEESAIKLHIVPMCGTVVEGLTIGWLKPMIEAARQPGMPLADQEGLDDIVVWYDVSGLTVRPDRSGDAKELYGLGVIGWRALLRECGFDESDYPTDDEIKTKVLLDVVAGAPTLAPIILAALGIHLDIPTDVSALPSPNAGGAPGAPGEAPPADTAGEPVPPATQDVPPPAPDAGIAAAGPRLDPALEAEMADAAADAAVLTAADAAVVRALEMAGRRIRNLARRDTEVAALLAPVGDAGTIHTLVDASCWADLGSLLDGAWAPVEVVAARYGVDPEPIVAVLDGYARALLAARARHTYEALRSSLDRQPAPT